MLFPCLWTMLPQSKARLQAQIVKNQKSNTILLEFNFLLNQSLSNTSNILPIYIL